VGIDDASFADLNRQWPWPRGYHARLIEQLQQAGAAVIAIDVVFAEPSDAEQDQLFAQAIKQAGNVVLASDIALQEREQFEQVIRVDPLNLFIEAGAIAGIATITVDNDRRVRQIPQAQDSLWQQTIRLYQLRSGLPPLNNNTRMSGGKVRFLGPDHTFTYVSYYQALDSKNMLPANLFRDKIVLVGLDVKTSPKPGASQADAFATPFLRLTGIDTPGVEVHATFMANALLNQAITETPRLLPNLLTIATLLLAMLGMRQWRPLRSSVIALSVVSSAAVFSATLFAVYNTWLPSLAAMIAPLLLYVVQGGVAFLYERGQKRQIRRVFNHYVAPQVVDEIISHPEKLVLGGARRDITLMFTDLQGFTSISEHLDAEQVSELLIRHFSEMTRIILDYGGTVDKFIGDAIMAFWGAPLEDPQQAMKACRAAMDMQQVAATMRRELLRQGLPGLRMRIGIHSGDAIVGNMGSMERFDYTAVGDNVNLASRIEGINKLYATGILISETTAKEVADQIPLLHVDKICVKGKSLPIEIYTLPIDPVLQTTAESAIQAYRQQQWDDAETQWQTLLAEEEPINSIARIYLARIKDYRHQGVSDDWDGSVSLE